MRLQGKFHGLVEIVLGDKLSPRDTPDVPTSKHGKILKPMFASWAGNNRDTYLVEPGGPDLNSTDRMIHALLNLNIPFANIPLAPLIGVGTVFGIVYVAYKLLHWQGRRTIRPRVDETRRVSNQESDSL